MTRALHTYPAGPGGAQGHAAAVEPLVVAEFGVAPGPEAALRLDTWGPQPRRVERGAHEGTWLPPARSAATRRDMPPHRIHMQECVTWNRVEFFLSSGYPMRLGVSTASFRCFAFLRRLRGVHPGMRGGPLR